jgi:hypothetical protein
MVRLLPAEVEVVPVETLPFAVPGRVLEGAER